MRAANVMSDGVMSVAADATVLEAAKLFVNCRVSAMPVVDESGIMIGIVSEVDLLQPQPGDGPAQHLLARAAHNPQSAADLMLAEWRGVTDVMTRDVVVAAEDTPLPELARLMIEHGVKRLPIVRGGAVVGIVSRADLLRALITLQGGDAPDDPQLGRDEQLRREISAACRGRNWSLARQFDVVVSGGVPISGASPRPIRFATPISWRPGMFRA